MKNSKISKISNIPTPIKLPNEILVPFVHSYSVTGPVQVTIIEVENDSIGSGFEFLQC